MDWYKKMKEEMKEDEWIEVDGYKGMSKDMCCQGFQYEIGKTYEMSKEDVIMCACGFHLCLELHDVFDYYSVGDGNRYFHVKAYVRKRDYEAYGKYRGFSYNDKLVAHKITIVKEVSEDELLELMPYRYGELRDIPAEYLRMAIESTPKSVLASYNTDRLINAGYSLPFAHYLATHMRSRVNFAIALGEQSGLSMDVKVLSIMTHKD